MRLGQMLLAAALISPASAGAQMAASVAWPVAAGSRVRVLSPVLGDQRQVGTAASASPDTLMFRPAKGTSTFTIATPNIAALDISTGTHTRKWKGAGIGFLIGAAVGAALGAATYKKQECTDFICLVPDSRAFDASLGAALVGIAGTVVGTLVGARSVDNWTPVAIPRPGATP